VRARRRVDERRPRFEPSQEQRDELARRFVAALLEGETEPLVELLAEDAAVYGDGGGKAPALARALHGQPRVARTLRAWVKLSARLLPVTWRRVEVNGQPGAITLDAEGRVVNVMALDIADGRIQAIRSVVNPDKLHHLGEVADLNALLQRD
jgi:RNA polymerase sigma-70 factor (ECF subfamily)